MLSLRRGFNMLKRLAHFIVLEETPKRFVSGKEAAEILGISVEKLYSIKNDENGTEKSST